MSDDPSAQQTGWTAKFAFAFSLILVAMGLANNLPNIPGLLPLVNSVPGLEDIPRLSKYNSEFFFPLIFVIIMIVVVLKSSFALDWRDRGRARFLCGLGIDVLMLTTAVVLACVYLIEHEQVCLIDTLDGERARLMAENAARAAEYREIFGTEADETIFPDCQDEYRQLGAAASARRDIDLFYLHREGLGVCRSWAVGDRDFCLYAAVIGRLVFRMVRQTDIWTTSIGTVSEGVRGYTAGVVGRAANAIILESNSLFGQFLNITVNVVFPYVVLGALFGASAGGRALIKLAVVITRRFRGGTAHAAIVGSATFGTISGGPVVNVLGTGTLTIPMMIRKTVFYTDFRRRRRGRGVERRPDHAAGHGHCRVCSRGPVGGALFGCPSSAAFLPAIAYFFSLFLMVIFESRRLKIRPVGKLTAEQKLTRTEWTNLLMILGPIVVILVLLLSTKDNVGSGLLGWISGYDARSGDELPWLLKLFQNFRRRFRIRRGFLGRAGSACAFVSSIPKSARRRAGYSARLQMPAVSSPICFLFAGPPCL